jgi:hypothetical protein
MQGKVRNDENDEKYSFNSSILEQGDLTCTVCDDDAWLK